MGGVSGLKEARAERSARAVLPQPSSQPSGQGRHDGRGGLARRPDSRGERGFALILAIWVLALLSVIAAVMAADVHVGAVEARNRLDLARARATAEAGISLAVLSLLNPNQTARWQADGRLYSLWYRGSPVGVRVFDEGGKIDLNGAPIELIASLLEEFGVVPERRSVLSRAILERRSAFAAAAASAAAKTGVEGRFLFRGNVAFANVAKLAFADSSELRLMPGMTGELYARVSPYLTTYSQSPTINPLTAARAVLLAIPGISPEDVDAFLAARDQAADQPTSPPLPGAARYVRIAGLRVVTIEAQASLGDHVRFARQAVVLASPNLPLQDERVLEWRVKREPVPPDGLEPHAAGDRAPVRDGRSTNAIAG